MNSPYGERHVKRERHLRNPSMGGASHNVSCRRLVSPSLIMMRLLSGNFQMICHKLESGFHQISRMLKKCAALRSNLPMAVISFLCAAIMAVTSFGEMVTAEEPLRKKHYELRDGFYTIYLGEETYRFPREFMWSRSGFEETPYGSIILRIDEDELPKYVSEEFYDELQNNYISSFYIKIYNQERPDHFRRLFKIYDIRESYLQGKHTLKRVGCKSNDDCYVFTSSNNKTALAICGKTFWICRITANPFGNIVISRKSNHQQFHANLPASDKLFWKFLKLFRLPKNTINSAKGKTK